MTGWDMLLFLVVTVQINIQGMVWSTNNRMNISTHIFRTAQLNMINNLEIFCCLHFFDITKKCNIMLNNLFILNFKVQVVGRQCTPKKDKCLASLMMQQSTHRTWMFILIDTQTVFDKVRVTDASVKHFTRPVESVGHMLFMYNLFPSPVWFGYLAIGKIKCCGSLHPICRVIPYEFGFKILKLKLDAIYSEPDEIWL